MGTHSYVVQAVKKSQEFPTPQDVNFTTNTFFYGPFHSNNLERNSWSYGCREVMHRDMREYITKKLVHNFNTLLGVRMYGEQYSAIVEILKENREENLTKLASFLANVTGISLAVDIETEKLACTHQYRKEGRTDLVQKKSYGDVRIFIPLWENKEATRLNTKICVIGALLKEPRIVTNVLSGKIHDVNTLVTELLHISKDRFEGKDTSYQCFGLVGSYGKIRETIMRDIQQSLAWTSNTDGSCWLDIAKLAVYIYYMNTRNLTGLLTGGEVGGPSDCATYHVRLQTYLEMFDNLPDKEILEFLGKQRSPSSNMRKAWVRNA